MNRTDLKDLASEFGVPLLQAPGNWVFTLDQLEAFVAEVMPKPLDEHRLDEYLPAWAYLEMTEGMRKEIVEVIQKQLGVL